MSSTDDRAADSVGPVFLTTAPVVQSEPRSRRPVSRAVVLILGCVIIPAALALALNSWGPLTDESAVRMFAATVAGQTIAILSAIVALVMTVKRTSRPAVIVGFAVIVLVVVTQSLSVIDSAGDMLFTRLDRVAEVDMLNR